MTGAGRAASVLAGRLDAVVLDIGGTLVAENPPATPTDELAVRLLPGVVADLAALAGAVRLAAATNTAVLSGADVRALLAGTGIDNYLEVIVTSTDVGAAKPDPAVLLTVCARLGIDPGRALYVGDRDTDAAAAAAAGMAYAPVGDAGVLAAVCDRLGAGVNQ